MIKKESTKLGYIADYKKDVDDIIDLLKTYPDNDDLKKNFLSSVVEMLERTYDITYDSVFDDIANFEKILPKKLEKLSQKISAEMENTFWGCLYSNAKKLGSEDEAKNLILEYIEDNDFEELLKELGTDFHSLFVDIRETYYNASTTGDEYDTDPNNSVELDISFWIAIMIRIILIFCLRDHISFSILPILLRKKLTIFGLKPHYSN